MIYRIQMLVMITVAVIVIAVNTGYSATDAPPPNAQDKLLAVKSLAPEEMIKAMVAKNMFKPAREPFYEAVSPDVVPADQGSKRLTRSFRLGAIDEAEGQPRAHLFFDNVRRVVKAGELIEFIVVKKINVQPPHIVCDYGGREVRVDVGESSDDALVRLLGFGEAYEFVGTQILSDRAYATVYYQGRYHRVEVGERLGNTQITRIEDGRMWLRFEGGYEYQIEPGAKRISP